MNIKNFAIFAALVALPVGSAKAIVIETVDSWTIEYEPVTLDGVSGVSAMTLFVTNASGNEQRNINGFKGTLGGAVGESGALHQERLFNGAVGTPTTASFTDVTQMVSDIDSHFLVPGELPIAAPREDGAVTPLDPPLAPVNAGALTGLGGPLTGEFTFPSVAGDRVELAYLVYANGTETIPYDFELSYAEGGGSAQAFSAGISFDGPDDMDPPEVTDLALGEIDPFSGDITATVEATDLVSPREELTWELGDPVFTVDPQFPGGTGILNPATISADGVITWDAVGSSLGDYEWPVMVTDAAGNTGTGAFSATIAIPEPATVGLIGLAVAGVVGFGRRRNG